MAVITYTVSVVGGKVVTSPTMDQITLTTGDFLIFNPDPASVTGDIFVQFTGGAKIYVAAAPTSKEMQFNPITIDGAGNITLSFAESGGDSGEGDGFPP